MSAAPVKRIERRIMTFPQGRRSKRSSVLVNWITVSTAPPVRDGTFPGARPRIASSRLLLARTEDRMILRDLQPVRLGRVLFVVLLDHAGGPRRRPGAPALSLTP